jgi:hypothetical protein
VSDTPQVALFLLPIVPVCIRLAAVRVRTTGDRLVVRNFLRTHDLHREEIERFVVEDYISGGPQSRSRTVYAYLRNGRWVSLAATSFGYWKFLAYWPRRNARNEADGICAALDEWLHAGP